MPERDYPEDPLEAGHVSRCCQEGGEWRDLCVIASWSVVLCRRVLLHTDVIRGQSLPLPSLGVEFFTSPKSDSCFQDFETGKEGHQEVLPRKSG